MAREKQVSAREDGGVGTDCTERDLTGADSRHGSNRKFMPRGGRKRDRSLAKGVFSRGANDALVS